MTLSDKIELLGIISSSLLSVIAIVISVATLLQNSRMIKESTRPYVTVYSNTTYFQSIFYYLIVKNFGQSGATITNFTCDYDLKHCAISFERAPFEHIVGTYLSPGQSLMCCIDSKKLCSERETLTFSISYSCGKQCFNEVITLNCSADADLVKNRASTKDKELKIISYALQDIAEKML